ncbi:MAG: ABC transporter permease [Candidatus Hydrogenedentes bacterium]|nr:ABC transporter permease [Candidatus Hydrogenedentota bacterium]
MWGQMMGLLHLRYRLFAHGLNLGKAFGLSVMILLAIGAVTCSAVLTVVAFRAGRLAAREEGPEVILLLLDGGVIVFGFFWIWGLLFELQRNDPIDFRRMLFLPISLRMVYVLNFLASLFSPGLAFFLFPLLGLVAGLAWYVHPALLLSLPAAVLFYVMAGAWSYFLRGWIAMLMQNKRRRRLLMTIIPIVFVGLSQLPLLFTRGDVPQKLERILAGAGVEVNETTVLAWIRSVNLVLPPGWLPAAVYALLHGDWAEAAVVTAGLGLIALAGLAIGYRTTLRHYMAGGKGTEGERSQQARRSRPLTGRRIPLLADDTAALVQANFLSYLRHPSIRLLLIMPLAMGALLLFVYAPRISGDDANPIARAFLPAAILVWPFFNFGAIIFNIFGIDRHGFRALLLLPTPRRQYLLAKNLALFPFVGGLGFVFLSIGFAFSGAGLETLLIALLQVIQIFLLFSAVGNFISVYFPYGVAQDSMRAPTGSMVAAFIGLASTLMVLLLMIPSAVCLVIDDLLRLGWGYQGLPVGVIASIVMIALSTALYSIALGQAGSALQAREQQVLATLIRENSR